MQQHATSWLRRYRFVLILFVPMAVALILGAGLSLVSAQYARQVEGQANQELMNDLNLAAESMGIVSGEDPAAVETAEHQG